MKALGIFLDPLGEEAFPFALLGSFGWPNRIKLAKDRSTGEKQSNLFSSIREPQT